MAVLNGVYTLPAGTATPVVSYHALGMVWSNTTWTDIQSVLSGIVGGTIAFSGTLTSVPATGLLIAANEEFSVWEHVFKVPAGSVMTVAAGGVFRNNDWTWPNQVFFSGAYDTLGLGISVLMPPKSEYRIKGPLVVPAGQVFTVPAGCLLQVADFFVNASGTISYANIQNVGASRLLGNPTAAAASMSEISLGTGLSFAGSVLNASATGAYTGTLDTLSANLTLAAASEYDVMSNGPLVVPVGDILTIPAGSKVRVADWTQPGQTPYTGSFITPPSTAGLTVLANSEYIIRGPTYTVPAGDVLTVQAGGYMRVWDNAALFTEALVFQNQTQNLAVGPGFILNKRSYGPVPYKIPAGVTLTIAAGAALIA